MNILFTILAIVGFLGVIATSIWYVAYRITRLFSLKKMKFVVLMVTLFFISSLVLMAIGSASRYIFVGVISTIAGYCIGFYMYLVMSLLIFHVLQLIIKTAPKQLVRWCPIGLAVLVTVVGGIQASVFQVNQIEIYLDDLKEDVDVMHISDVHLGYQRGKEYLSKIVHETNQYKPDLVVITGDLIESNHALLPGELEPLSEFDAPVYYVGGNHENYLDEEEVFRLMKDQGVTVLRNEVIKTPKLTLVGLDYMRPDEETMDVHATEDKRTIKDELAKLTIDQETPSILLLHNAIGLEYIEEAGIDLLLSGHTHGGQMFPGTLLNQFLTNITKDFMNSVAHKYL